MFQCSLNFESSLKFFSAEFLGWIFFQLFNLVEFRLILLLFLGKLLAFTVYRLFKKRVTKPFWQLKFSCLQFGPRIRTEGLNSSSRQKGEVAFWCCVVWDSFSLFYSSQIKYCTWSAWFFFLRNKFSLKGKKKDKIKDGFVHLFSVALIQAKFVFFSSLLSFTQLSVKTKVLYLPNFFTTGRVWHKVIFFSQCILNPADWTI